MPIPGNKSVLLIPLIILLLYTCYAFKIRDVLVEQQESLQACTSSTSGGKCHKLSSVASDILKKDRLNKYDDGEDHVLHKKGEKMELKSKAGSRPRVKTKQMIHFGGIRESLKNLKDEDDDDVVDGKAETKTITYGHWEGTHFRRGDKFDQQKKEHHHRREIDDLKRDVEENDDEEDYVTIEDEEDEDQDEEGNNDEDVKDDSEDDVDDGDVAAATGATAAADDEDDDDEDNDEDDDNDDDNDDDDDNEDDDNEDDDNDDNDDNEDDDDDSDKTKDKNDNKIADEQKNMKKSTYTSKYRQNTYPIKRDPIVVDKSHEETDDDDDVNLFEDDDENESKVHGKDVLKKTKYLPFKRDSSNEAKTTSPLKKLKQKHEEEKNVKIESEKADKVHEVNKEKEKTNVKVQIHESTADNMKEKANKDGDKADKVPEDKPDGNELSDKLSTKTVTGVKKVKGVSKSESDETTSKTQTEVASKIAVAEEKEKKAKKSLKTSKSSTKAEAKTKQENESSTGEKSESKSKVAESKKEKKSAKVKRQQHSDASITLAELNNVISHVPTFVPNYTAVQDPVCQQHGKIFLRQLRGYKLWAMQMLDSSAKIPSGVLHGNVNQLGDYDQCLGVIARVKVDEKTIKIQGKYCLATIDLHATHPDMKVPVNLMQSRAFIRGNMRDPGHFIPRFTTVNWALCLPAACSATDAQSAIEQAFSVYNVTSGIKFTVDVDPNMCYVEQKSWKYSKETIGVLYFYAMILCLVGVATIRDCFVAEQGKRNYSERIIMSFSLKRTTRALLNDSAKNTNDIKCIHGIRSLATIALYIAHQLIPLARIPFTNRVALTEVSNNPVSSVLRVSLVYTDCFLLLSGVLTAYNMGKELTNRGEIRWFCRFITRFIRLTPVLLVVVFWYAFVMEYTGSGPQWNSVVTANAELCKKNAWTNLLYIQNFFPFEEMCATHTHQLALDMQLSLLAPVLVFFLNVKPIIGLLLIFFILQVSATLRYIATANNHLSLVIFHGMSIKHLYKTANMTYALPLHRATSYVFGVGLGVLLHYTGKNIKIHRVLVILGWLIAMALGSWSLFSPWHLARRDYLYDAEDATRYAVISPVFWAIALCWTIFACYTDHGGIINKFLSNYWLMVFSRISYAVYLTQFAVFFYNVGSTRYSSEFRIHRALDVFEVLTVTAVSVILTLTFDLPMQEVKNVIMECTDNLDTENKVSDSATIEKTERRDDDAKSETHLEQVRNRNQEVKLKPVIKRSTITHDNYESEEMPTWEWIKGPRSDVLYDNSREDIYSDGRKSRASQRSEDSDEEDFRQKMKTLKDSDRDFERHRRQELEEYKESRARSVSRELDERERRRDFRARSVSKEKESYPWERRPLADQQQLARKAFIRSEPRCLSSESEEEFLQSLYPRYEKPDVRLRPVEYEEDDDTYWKEKLQRRRREFLEKQKLQSEEEDWSSLRRRSSAEGKLALLKDSTSNEGMDSWTRSMDPRIHFGSSQEEAEEYNKSNRRQDSQSDTEVTWDQKAPHVNVEREGEDLTLKKRTSVHDLNKLSREEEDGWSIISKDTESTQQKNLFKRESIIKSQASEEDTEYLVPERPKLIEQEQEHPFKKAWQMQKSRSEEEGSSALIVKQPVIQKVEDAKIARDTVGRLGQIANNDSDLMSRSNEASEGNEASGSIDSEDTRGTAESISSEGAESVDSDVKDSFLDDEGTGGELNVDFREYLASNDSDLELSEEDERGQIYFGKIQRKGSQEMFRSFREDEP